MQKSPHKISALFPWKNVETKSKWHWHWYILHNSSHTKCFYFQLLTEWISLRRTDRVRSVWCSLCAAAWGRAASRGRARWRWCWWTRRYAGRRSSSPRTSRWGSTHAPGAATSPTQQSSASETERMDFIKYLHYIYCITVLNVCIIIYHISTHNTHSWHL